jgi:hypothetical protein
MGNPYKVMKPCPFCGRIMKAPGVWKGPAAREECPRCGAMGPLPAMGTGVPYRLNLTDREARQREKAAVLAWNERHVPKHVADLIRHARRWFAEMDGPDQSSDMTLLEKALRVFMWKEGGGRAPTDTD